MYMCEGCKPPKHVRYEGKAMILEDSECVCKDCSVTEFSPSGARCVNCEHLIPVHLTDESEWDNPLFLVNGFPVRLDEIKA